MNYLFKNAFNGVTEYKYEELVKKLEIEEKEINQYLEKNHVYIKKDDSVIKILNINLQIFKFTIENDLDMPIHEFIQLLEN